MSKRSCSTPGCGKPGLHLCSGCGEEIYCSKECQVKHWKLHKLACRTAVKPEIASIMQSFDQLSVKQLKNMLLAKSASMETKKKANLLEQVDKAIEKQQLLFLAKQHVHPSEIEVLLTNSAPSVQPTSLEVDQSGGSKKSRKVMRKMPAGGAGAGLREQALGNGLNPTPEQMRQQANLMRRNPELVRKSNPMFAKMTNAQIIQYAEQIEKAASDPTMMQEIERMSKMSTKERDQLQHFQEGVSGTRPMDDKWADATIQTLKSNPELFKTMLRGKGAAIGGFSDSQIESFIDFVASLSAGTLKIIFKVIKFLGSLIQPATDLYNTIDKYTFGLARYIFIGLFMFVASFVAMFVFRIMRFVFSLVLALWAKVSGSAAASAAVSETVTATASKSAYQTLSDAAAGAAGAAANAAANAAAGAADEFAGL